MSVAALTASQAQAQVVTDIAPDTAPGFDTGTVVSTSGSETQISGGELSGTNLVHSFAEFDLGNGDTATWVRGMADANTITNVINRVRSGTPSNIDGTLTMADMPNADFWFINPAGVVFGEGAAVQVPNAAYFSTAHEIGFAVGQSFSTVTPDGSTFSSAPPQAFGFLGEQAAIGVLGTLSTEESGQRPTSVTFVGADIRVDAPVLGNETEFNFHAVGTEPLGLAITNLTLLLGSGPVGTGQIEFAPGARAYVAGARLSADRVLLDGAQIFSNGWGYLALRGNEVVLTNNALVETSTAWGQTGVIQVHAQDLSITDGATLRSISDDSNAIAGGAIGVVADSVTIASGGKVIATSDGLARAGDITFDTSFFNFSGEEISSVNNGSGDSGNVSVSAQEFFMDSGIILSEVYGDGASGDVSIDAGALLSIAGQSTISTGTDGPGRAGSVFITGDEVLVAGDARITSQTTSSGDAGSVEFDVAGLLWLRDNALVTSSTDGIGNTGNAGSVNMNAGTLRISDGAQIDSSTREEALGNAGVVDITVDRLEMSGGFIYTSTYGAGNAGTLHVDAGEIHLSGTGTINSRAVEFSTGNAGNVFVSATNLIDLTDDGTISASTEGPGLAGSVVVTTPLLIMDGGKIDSSTTSGGDAGDVLITADVAELFGLAKVNSAALEGSTGNAGSVLISTGDLFVEGLAEVSASTEGPGDAGNVAIIANQLNMDGGEITSFTSGEGDAGLITISAQDAYLTNLATINSLADGDETGNAGGVIVDVPGQLVMTDNSIIDTSTFGSGTGGIILVQAGELHLESSLISSLTDGAGDAGDVLVTVTDVLEIGNLSSISASSSGAGNAGFVEVASRVLTMGPGSAINSFTAGIGDAGVVLITVDELTMTGGRIDSASDSDQLDAGDASVVKITAHNATLSGTAQIDSRAQGGNAGGVILEVYEVLDISGDAQISAATDGPGEAGLVSVSADQLLMSGGGINSFTSSSGNAGLVEVEARQIRMTAGRIDSSSDGNLPDSGNAGGVSVRGNDIALSGTALIDSRATTGDAGDVFVEATGKLSMADEAQISAATEGSGEAGRVSVTANLLTMTGGDINSVTNGSGLAGLVVVDVGSLEMLGGRITSASEGPFPEDDLSDSIVTIANEVPVAGNAGNVVLLANSVLIDGSASIDSTSVNSNAGGVTLLIPDSLLVLNGGQVSTAAGGGGDAGAITIITGYLEMNNFGRITSTAGGPFTAGTIDIAANEMQILNGSEVSTNSENGPAGDIILQLPQDGLLRLAGQEFPGIITTSSGANTGGQIIISDPYLILSEGGSILALGQQGGANVQIQSAFFIRSSDALNLVSVDGSLLIESNVGEQITGTEVADVPFLDASGILSGQCSGVRQSGEVSQFSSRITGPYAPPDDAVDTEEEDSEEPATDRVVHLNQGNLAPCG